MTKFIYADCSYKLKKTSFLVRCFSISLLVVTLFSSCGIIKNSYYFKEVKRDTTISSLVTPSIDLKIQKKDLLAIGVTSFNKEDDIFYNGEVLPPGVPLTYSVDSNGNIQFHRLGLVKVEGKSLSEVKTELESELQPYLKDPIIKIAFANHKITVFGSVAHATAVNIVDQPISLFDALVQAGDLTADAVRRDVLIIRDSANKKQFTHINLENTSVFNSQYYYLQPNDLVYVRPNIEKTERDAKLQRTQQVITMTAGTLSIILFVLDRVIK
ncbi:polysaccharide biosynthesis/export family protein [Ferruginibacter albus]|uniref:polysaccharide biosynthesis/export family protein n=1 Tax=Ferruginibacter albus TaxID=2875540 RepID=UPI001CC7A522|nr:polysaccharide biosynthesis/export family protein [Ferruginibacter albus]UAY50707.1 polysaccharide biosynthesis/export family protein [Ferruginibacter albus]